MGDSRDTFWERYPDGIKTIYVLYREKLQHHQEELRQELFLFLF